MKRQARTRAVVVATSVALAAAIGCGGSGGGSVFGNVVVGALAPSFDKAPRADVSGQADAFTGKLGTGTFFSFMAIHGVTYVFTVGSQKGGDDIVLDVFDKDGNELKSKSLTTNSQTGYTHDDKTEFLLVLIRPAGPLFDTGIQITQCRVQGLGQYDQTKFNVNFVVAGDDFSGYGNFNDLKSTADRAAFTNAVMAKVSALYGPHGINPTFEGFSLTTSQIQATQPLLTTDTGKTIAHAGEIVNAQGFGDVDTTDLDRWGSFGFSQTDPVQSRANGLDIFVIHHFETDGVVGLSPRPGSSIQGNGPGTALCVGAFLKIGTNFTPRTTDQIGLALAHEIGHFLGLQHTTTFDPPGPNPTRAIDDGLSDTPAAGTLTDKNGDGVVGIGDGCADENNVMFWEAGPPASQNIFSPMQINVIKSTLSQMPH